jgi:SSS family solute:Na+ symporter
VVAYLLLSVAFGIYANRYIGRLSDFLVAGRAVRTYLGIATITGTEIGLITLMYAAGDGYNKGLAAMHIGVAWGAGASLIGLTGFIIYRLRMTGVMTIPEYYGQRYNMPVRWVGGVILAFAGILNMGLFLRAGADFITAVTGLHSEGWLKLIMTILMALVLLYTILGGMVSIIITDLVQYIVLSFGMVVVTLFAVHHIGWSTIFEVTAEAKGEVGLNPFAADSGYGWMYVISMILMAFSATSLWQSATLRALSAREGRTAKKIYTWAGVTFFARIAIPAFWGACAFVFLSLPENADLAARFAETPDATGNMLKPIQAMPVMLGQIMPPILLGLIVAAMIAAFMSTHDSYLLSWASVLTQDVVAPLLKKELSDSRRILLTRLFIVAQGIYLLIWGLWFPAPASLWDYMATTGTVYLSGASAVVVCGLYWRRASNAGALAALLIGLVAVLPIFKHWLPPQWMVTSMPGLADIVKQIVNQEYITRVFAFAASWLAMIIFSLIFPRRSEQTAYSSGAGFEVAS